MSRFTKTVLKAGTYQSPDGEVIVTADRLRHWQKQFRRMNSAKQVVPVGWDHSEEEDALRPMSLANYKRKRSARDTIGRLVGFDVRKDGSAEITLDIRDSHAKKQAETNNVYVSPVIFDSWRDGQGNEYQDVVTHVDFVNHPVDHSQGPFRPATDHAVACSLRMGLSTPYRLAAEPDTMSDDDKKTDKPESKPKSDSTALKDVMAALAKLDIVISDDTTEDTFLDRLHQALLTADAHRSEPGDDEPTIVADDAGIAAMSLESKAALAYAERTHRAGLKSRMSAILESGRCTPEEMKSQEHDLGAVKLSLGSDGNPKSSRMEDWIESREAVPKGTFWDSARKTKLSQVAELPTGFTGEMSDEDAGKLAKEVLSS